MAVPSQSEPRSSEELALVRMNFSTYEAARAVISAHERTDLQGIDHAAFFAALDQPVPATPALKAAFQRHQRTVVSR